MTKGFCNNDHDKDGGPQNMFWIVALSFGEHIEEEEAPSPVKLAWSVRETGQAGYWLPCTLWMGLPRWPDETSRVGFPVLATGWAG